MTEREDTLEAFALHQGILDALPAHVCLIDEHGLICLVNRAWCTFVNENMALSDDGYVGKNYLDICDRTTGECSEGASDVAAGIRAVLRGELAEYTHEYSCHAPNEQRWFRVFVTPFSGKRALIMHVNISAERQAKLEFQASESRFRAIVDIEPEGIDVVSRSGEVQEMNAAGLRILEATLSEIRAQPLEAFVHPSDRAMYQAFHSMVVAGSTGQLQCRLVTARGNSRWVELYAIPLRREHGEVEGVMHIVADRSALHRTVEELEQREVLAKIAGRAARLGGWSITFPGDRVEWSDETTRIHGESTGFSPTIAAAISYYTAEYRQRIIEAFCRCTEERRPVDLEAQLCTAQGNLRWVRVLGEAIRDTEGRVKGLQGAIQDITHEKATAEQIETLGARLLEAFESASDGIFLFDSELRFTFINTAAERIIERRRDELLGRDVLVEFGEAVGPTFEIEFRHAMGERTARRFEAYYPPLSRWLDVHAYPSSDGIAVYFRDITEARAHREALHQSEERFRLLSLAANDAVWDWDLESGAVWWNEGITTQFGIPAGEVERTIGGWMSRLHPDDREGVLDSLHATLQSTSQVWSSEYRFARYDGTYAYVLDRGHISRSSHGRANRIVGGLTDLTERRRNEERLQEQATLLDKARDAIVVRDLNHRVLYWNCSAERVYGWTAAEITGSTVRDKQYPDATAFDAAFETTMAQGEWVGELEQKTKDGRLIVTESHWSLVRDARGAPKSILAIHTDITQRKKLEEQMLRAQRLDSIGAIAGGIAHDINNVLAPILMTATLMRMDETDAERLDDLNTIEACALRGAEMVKQVLTFARGTGGKKEKILLRIVAHEVQKIARETFPKAVNFRLAIDPSLWDVNADPTQIQQLLMNLCVNARDAMPTGGTLTVALENAPVDMSVVSDHVDAKIGPYVCIRVEDTGTGMSREVRDHIFEPFFTTKEFGMGTGLGLSTVHAIVQNHAGFLDVESEVGRGTKVKVYLPALVSAETLLQVLAPPATLIRGNGERVLVVDDEEALRRAAGRILENYGYEVLLARDGEEALAVYRQFRDKIAVVLTDMDMPVLDGPSTVLALKKINPRVKIIGSSGLFPNPKLEATLGATVTRFVPKPYGVESLLRAVMETLLTPSIPVSAS